MAPTTPSAAPSVGPKGPNGKVEWSMENLRSAERHFEEFFNEIGDHMIEREDLIAQVQLALLAHEHVLEIGHPGTAKSTIAKMVYGRIVDSETGEPSFFDKPVNLETRTGEVAGPLLPKTDPLTGEMDWIRKIVRGIAPRDYAFIDEFFDAPPAVLRGALLQALNERTVERDGKAEPIKLRSAVAASNKTMEEAALLAEKAGTNLDAIFDRFAFIFWTCQRTLRDGSDEKMVKQAALRKVKVGDSRGSGLEVPPLTSDEMDLLRETVLRVKAKMTADGWAPALVAGLYNTYHGKIHEREAEIRKRTKIYSGRSMTKLVDLLPAIAVARHIKHPETPLAVMPEDFKELRLNFMMRGPVAEDIPTDPGSVGNRQDEEMLKRFTIENEAFNEAYSETVAKHVAENVERDIPADLTPIKDAIEFAEKTAVSASTTESDLETALESVSTRVFPVCEKLPLSAREAGEGEKMYVRAVVAYVDLLRKAVTMGLSERFEPKNRFVHLMRTRAASISSLAVPPELARAVSKFEVAVADEYKENAKKPHSVDEMIRLMFAIINDNSKGILNESTIDALQAIVRYTCFSRMVSGSPDMPKREYSDDMVVGDEISAIERLSASLTPVESFALRATTLKYMRDAVSAVKNDFGSRIANALERERIADVLDRLKEIYETARLEDDSSVEFQISGDEIPPDFLSEKRAAIETKFGSTAVSHTMAGPNRVKWTSSKTESRDFDADQLKTEYGEFLAKKVIGNKDVFLKLPSISKMLGKLMDLLKTHLGEEAWLERYGEIIKTNVLKTCEDVLDSKADGMLDFPFPIAGIQFKSAKIPFAYVQKAVEGGVAALKADGSALAEFMASKGLANTQTNLAAFGGVLNGAGKVTASVEIMQSVEEEIKPEDIVEFEKKKEAAYRDSLKREVKMLIEDAERMYAEQIVREKQGQLSTPISAGGAVTPASFIEKWDLAARSVSSVTGGDVPAGRFHHLKIPTVMMPSITAALEADMKALVAGTAVDGTRGLRDVLLAPFGDVKKFCEDRQSEYVLRAASAEATAKLKEWLAARGATIVAIGTGAQIPPTEGFDKRVKALAGSRIQLSTITVPTADDLATTSEAAAMFNVDPATVAELSKTSKRLSFEHMNSKVAVCEAYVLAMQDIEMPECGFRFADLNTLTPDNQTKVVEKARKFFTTIEKVFADARENAEDIGARCAELELAQPEIDGVKGRISAAENTFQSLRNAFNDRSAALSRA